MKTIAAIIALLFAPAASALYKCVDEQGRTHVAETPPAACEKVPMFEVSKAGHVLRRIEPTPTPEQLKVREAEAQRRREADKAAAEQRRYDQALLSTFSSEHEFEFARDRNIEPINGRIRAARERMKDVDQRIAKIDEEAEFYKASTKKGAKEREVPRNLVDERERLAREKQSLAASIAANEKDIAAQRERFERDRKRWVELRAGGGTAPVVERK